MSQTNPETTPLHTLNPLTRFSDRAADYVNYRPSYPAAAIDIILEGLAPPTQLLAADIGAGTGISSRLLGKRGVRVIAVEPNAAMREAAEPHPLVEFRDGTAEVTNLANESVDLVTSFQAFHWFNLELTLSEFHRILKPSGRLAVVWNHRDQEDAFTAEYNELIRAASNSGQVQERIKSVKPILASLHFINITEHTFVHQQELDLTGLIGRTMSYSFVPRKGLMQQQLVVNLQELYQRFVNEHGFVYMVDNTSVHILQAIES